MSAAVPLTDDPPSRVFAVLDADDVNWFANHGDLAIELGPDISDFALTARICHGHNVTLVIPDQVDEAFEKKAWARAFIVEAQRYAAGVYVSERACLTPDEFEEDGMEAAEWLLLNPPNASNDATSNDRMLMPAFTLAELHGMPIPERRWLVKDLIPARNVTEADGDGGVGKSRLYMQLGIAVASGRNWIGRETAQGSVLYLACEDERDEIHIRAQSIAEHYMLGLNELGNFHVISMVGRDATLAVENRGRSAALATTPNFEALKAHIARLSPALVLLDTRADLFAGEANSPAQARMFMTILRGLAVEHDCAIVLLSHPSLTGLNNGRGGSGATAWRNSARSALLLERVMTRDESGRQIEADTLARTLTVKKLNYGPDGGKIALRWHEGVFIPTEEEAPSFLDKKTAERRVDELFLELLAAYEAEGRPPAPNMNRCGAPILFATDPRARGITKQAFNASMNRLLAAHRIRIVTSGPSYRPVQKLATLSPTAPHDEHE